MSEHLNGAGLQEVRDRLTRLEVTADAARADTAAWRTRIEASMTALVAKQDAMSTKFDALAQEIHDAKTRVGVVEWIATRSGPLAKVAVAGAMGWIAAHFWPGR